MAWELSPARHPSRPLHSSFHPHHHHRKISSQRSISISNFWRNSQNSLFVSHHAWLKLSLLIESDSHTHPINQSKISQFICLSPLQFIRTKLISCTPNNRMSEIFQKSKCNTIYRERQIHIHSHKPRVRLIWKIIEWHTRTTNSKARIHTQTQTNKWRNRKWRTIKRHMSKCSRKRENKRQQLVTECICILVLVHIDEKREGRRVYIHLNVCLDLFLSVLWVARHSFLKLYSYTYKLVLCLLASLAISPPSFTYICVSPHHSAIMKWKNQKNVFTPRDKER